MAKKKHLPNKPVKKKQAKSNEEFFAAVNNPQFVRLSVLETRRAVLESMKNFKELKEIRKEKIHEKTALRKSMRQISSLLTKIKTALPTVKMPSSTDDLDMGRQSLQESMQKRDPSHHEELSRIESELAEIDNQLAGL